MGSPELVVLGLVVVAIFFAFAIAAARKPATLPPDRIQRQSVRSSEELEARICILLMRDDWRVGDRTEDYAFLVRRPRFNIALAIVLALTTIGVFIYAIWFLFQQPDFVEITVDPAPTNLEA